MARKAIDPKDGQGPGYSEAGYIGKGQWVVLTYRVSGLDIDAAELACDRLWQKYRKGLSADWGAHGTHEATAGPKINAAGEVVYSLHTIYQGDGAEAKTTAEVQRLTGGKVTMSHTAPPPLPPAIPGIDAPATEAEAAGK